MRFVTRYSPVGLHFGSLDTRLLQLSGTPRGWTVSSAEVASAQGIARHSQAATELATRIKGRILGKDSTISTTAAQAALTVVPIEASQTERLVPTLEEAAARAIDDPEGINYRFLPLNRTLEDADERDEYLLVCLGESEQRRCTSAGESLQLRPVALEIAPFAVARALTYAEPNATKAVGFLHLGIDHAYFGITFENEIRFLKPMEHNGADILDALHQAVETHAGGNSAQAMALGFLSQADDAGDEQENDGAMSATNALTMLEHFRRQSKEPDGAAMMRALRLQGGNLGQEIRACLWHFHARNPGISVGRVAISGFGGGLPSITDVLTQSLKIDVELAQPFTQIGISTPPELLREQHLWCAPLGLALRSEV